MRPGLVGIGLVMAILLGGTLVQWSYQWEESMRDRANHECSTEPDRLLFVPGALVDPKSYGTAGEWKPLWRKVSCEELVGK